MRDIDKWKSSMMHSNEEAETLIDKHWGNFPVLPDINDPEVQEIIYGFRARIVYIKKFGFVLLTSQFQEEVKKIANIYNIHSFLELGSGTGTFSKFLQNIGLTGTGYTLELHDDISKNRYGLASTDIYKECVQDGTILVQDMLDVIHDDPYDMAVATWVDINGGHQHMTFFEKNGIPKWYLTINEEGGCTGSEEYYDWLHANFVEVHTFKEYKPFSGVWDSAVLWTKKL